MLRYTLIIATIIAAFGAIIASSSAAPADGYCVFDCAPAHSRHRHSGRRNRHRHVVRIERENIPTAWREDDDDWGRDRGDRGERREGCLDKRIRGLGTQWIGTEGAMDAAKKDWMERTRYDHGESYLDLSHAEQFESRCGRVSVGEVAGQVLYRCEIRARPCKADFEKTEGFK